MKLSPQLDVSSVFTDFKEYEGANLTRPSEEFLNSLENLENKFICCFSNMYFLKNFEGNIFNILKNEFIYNCCKNENKEFLIKFYVRVRVYHIIKQFNKDNKKTSNKQKFLSVAHL